MAPTNYSENYTETVPSPRYPTADDPVAFIYEHTRYNPDTPRTFGVRPMHYSGIPTNESMESIEAARAYAIRHYWLVQIADALAEATFATRVLLDTIQTDIESQLVPRGAEFLASSILNNLEQEATTEVSDLKTLL